MKFFRSILDWLKHGKGSRYRSGGTDVYIPDPMPADHAGMFQSDPLYQPEDSPAVQDPNPVDSFGPSDFSVDSTDSGFSD